jgi:phosphoglycerate dehydrogenase-like enzyme/predicted dehydrogenase
MPGIRALVVGAGETSTLMHLPVLARLRDQGRLELVETCDLRLDRAKAAMADFGFARRSGDAASALAEPDIDAVYVFADAWLHYDLGLAALKAGKHLFVEKPIAPGSAEAHELAELAAVRGLIAVGGHNRRFYRPLEEIRTRGGKAGWRFAEATFHKPAHSGPPPFGARSWLSANGIHALDALVHLMGGLPEELTAFANGGDYSALMRWADGGQGVFLCNNHAGERREAYAFHAPGETLRVGDESLEIGDGFEAEHIAFLDAIKDGVPPRHSLAELAPSLRLAELIEAGFSGRIEGPQKPTARVIPLPRRPVAGSMLVVNAGALKSTLASNPTGRPLVALEELSASPRPRPDIVASLLGTGPSALTPEVLDRLPNLRVAGLVGLSFSRHAPDLLLERGVALVNASEAYAESVAEFAFGLMILARRRAFASDRIMRQGGWGTTVQPRGWRGALDRMARGIRPDLARSGLEPLLLKAWRGARPLHGIESAPPSPARELRGAMIGLIGWGASARALAKRLAASGAKTIAWSEHAETEDIEAAGGMRASLAEVLAADVVSLHRGLSAETRHFLGAAELERLRPGAVLINIARAALIEPDALLARLKRGDIFACLDVFEEEPPPARHPLRRLPNVCLTSHLAGGSAELRSEALGEVLDKIEQYLGGGSAAQISRERLRTMT